MLSTFFIVLITLSAITPIHAVTSDSTDTASVQSSAEKKPSGAVDTAAADEEDYNPWLPVEDELPDTTAIKDTTPSPADKPQPPEETSLPDTTNRLVSVDSVDTQTCILHSIDSVLDITGPEDRSDDILYADRQTQLDSMFLHFSVQLEKLLQETDSLHSEITTLQKDNEKLYTHATRPVTYRCDRWGVGYEEGLGFRYRLNKKKEPQQRHRGLTFGAGYQLNQLKDQYHRALHEGHLRIGFYQEFAVFPRVRIAAYFDAMERMKQQQAEPLLFETTYNRYALWITKLRAGVHLHLFSLEHFLLTYRFGFEFAYSTPPYIVNASKTTFTKYGTGIFRFGMSGSDLSALEMIINNIGIYIYF